jgi:hypothetical protein
MTDFTTRSAFEAKTHEMFDANVMDANGIEWSPERQIVAMVWRACWSNTLSVEQISKIGQALSFGVKAAIMPDLQPMLTLMTRKKMLRACTRHGVRHYEVNY